MTFLCCVKLSSIPSRENSPPDAALLVTAIGMPWLLPESLVNLHPTRFDSVGGSQCRANIVGPNICGETVMTVIGHAYRVHLVVPRDGDEHRSKNLLARQTPVIGGISKNGRDREITLAQWPLFRRQASEYPLCLPALQTLLDIGANLLELLFVDNAADIRGLVQWVAKLQQSRPVSQFVEKSCRNVGM